MTSQSPLSITAFLQLIEESYTVTSSYRPAQGQPTLTTERKNLLVLQWFRVPSLDNYRTNRVNGTQPDYNFINHANSLKQINGKQKFIDPAWSQITIQIAELFSMIETIYLRGGTLLTSTPSGSSSLSSQTPAQVNLADISSWGGDFVAFYSEWRRAITKRGEDIPGDSFSRDNLFTPTSNALVSKFKLPDLIADADAWNIAKILKSNPNTPLPNVLQAYYTPFGTGGVTRKTRLKSFYESRFSQVIPSPNPPSSSPSTTTVKIVLAMLTSYPQDPSFVTERWNKMKDGVGAADEITQPAFVDVDLLVRFCVGFEEGLKALIGKEPAMV